MLNFGVLRGTGVARSPLGNRLTSNYCHSSFHSAGAVAAVAAVVAGAVIADPVVAAAQVKQGAECKSQRLSTAAHHNKD